MKPKILIVIGTLALSLALLLGSIKASWAIQKVADFKVKHPLSSLVARFNPGYSSSGVPQQGCSVRPKLNPPEPNIETTFVPGQLTLERFRKKNLQATLVSQANPENQVHSLLTYTPREEIALAHPTNFGERYLQDLNGRPATYEPIIVLHETVSAGWQAIKMFQTPHPRDDDQASYHALIKLDGTIFYLVPPDKRAFGAGNSVFASAKGMEAVQTNRKYSASVNNFAYHISFESPPDGRGDGTVHSGYTEAQYRSAAWLVSKTGVPEARITTHKGVDRSGTRIDPRSFNREKFLQLLRLLPKSQEVAIGCGIESMTETVPLNDPAKTSPAKNNSSKNNPAKNNPANRSWENATDNLQDNSF